MCCGWRSKQSFQRNAQLGVQGLQRGTSQLPRQFDWWVGNVISKHGGVVYVIARDGANAGNKASVLPAQSGQELDCVSQHPVYIRTPPPLSKPLYHGKKKLNLVKIWPWASYWSPTTAFCFSLQHSKAVVVGGTQRQVNTGICCLWTYIYSPFLSNECTFCHLNSRVNWWRGLCDMRYLTEPRHISYHGDWVLLTLQCLAPECCIKSEAVAGFVYRSSACVRRWRLGGRSWQHNVALEWRRSSESTAKTLRVFRQRRKSELGFTRGVYPPRPLYGHPLSPRRFKAASQRAQSCVQTAFSRLSGDVFHFDTRWLPQIYTERFTTFFKCVSIIRLF